MLDTVTVIWPNSGNLEVIAPGASNGPGALLLPMPAAAPRPCRHPGCAQLVRDGSGYCQAHQSDARAGTFADARRGSRHERGYGSEWDRTRKRILRRDHGLCQVCLSIGRYTPADQVDHIINKARGGTGADENLQSICRPCHQAKTAAEAMKGRGV